MSFLDKFKGKTTIMTKDEVGGILGRATSQPNVKIISVRLLPLKT